ncbi:MAG TPA: hypothetical protein VF234_01385 [Limnochordia bacterium]
MRGLAAAIGLIYSPRQVICPDPAAVQAGAESARVRSTAYALLAIGLVQGAIQALAWWQPELVRQSALWWIGIDPSITLPEAVGRARFLAVAGIPWQVVAVAASSAFIAAVLWIGARIVGCRGEFAALWRLAVLSEWIATLGWAVRYLVLFSRDLSGLTSLRDVPIGLGLSLIPGFGWPDVGLLAFTFWRDFDLFGIWRWLFLAAGASWLTVRRAPTATWGQAVGMTRIQGAVAGAVALGTEWFLGFVWLRFGPDWLAWFLRLGR